MEENLPPGLAMDAAGNLYGTTWGIDTPGYGTVFQLAHSGSGWALTPIYRFAGGNDGAYPEGGVAIAQDGTLYGTTTGEGAAAAGQFFA
jgi:hypothetical protein